MLETIAIVITYCYAIPCCTAVILHFLPSHLEPVRSADKETKTTASAALWLRVTFSWINPLIGLGANLEGRDLKRFMDADDAPDALYDKFSRTRRSDSLARRIIAFNRHELAWQFTFALLFSLSEYVSPYFFQLFLRCIQESTPAARSTAFRYLMIMLAAEIGKTVFETQMLHISRRIDIRLKSVLPLEIFARALSSTDHSGHPPSTSQSDGRDAEDPVDINLTSDVNRIAEAANRIHGIYTAPLSLIFGVVQLYQLLGWSALVGLATMSAAVLLSSGCSVTFSRIMGHVMSIRDNRLALTRELIQGIRTIKINTWERPFTDKIFKVRELELERMRAVYTTSSSIVFIFLATPVLVTLGSFVAFTKLAAGQLTAPTAFTAIQLFTKLRDPLYAVPVTVNTFVSATLSYKRITAFLEASETRRECPVEVKETNISFRNATIRWTHERHSTSKKHAADDSQAQTKPSTSFTLRELDISFPAGELSLVCGSTGSGKSALLMALLGEMTLMSGTVEFPKVVETDNLTLNTAGLTLTFPSSVAYVSQQAWLQSGTIRDNVLFGWPLDQQRYDEVLDVCALRKDLDMFEHGDMTVIGENGTALSGGQKQRVSLARAVYSSAQVVLLDDCLSSADAATAQHVYERCLIGSLMHGRTRLLVTHHVRLCLPGARYIVKMDGGRVAYKAIVSKSSRIEEILKEVFQTDGIDTRKEEFISEPDPRTKVEMDKDVRFVQPLPFSDGGASVNIHRRNSIAAGNSILSWNHEIRPRGQVFRDFFDACGGIPFWAVITCIILIRRVVSVGEGWWLKMWSSDPSAASKLQTSFNADRYLGVYVTISLTGLLMEALFMVAIYSGSLKASRAIHRQVLQAIARAPLRFFDTNTVGDIISRFGKDLEVIDGNFSSLANECGVLLGNLVAVAMTIGVISTITPVFLIASIGVGVVYIYIGNIFSKITRELKWLELSAHGAMVAYYMESVRGAVTIRAFGKHNQFTREMASRLENSILPYHILHTCERWLSVRAHSAAAVMSFLAGFFILLSPSRIDAGVAGLSLSQAINFLRQIDYLLRRRSALEMHMNSVERVGELMHLPTEEERARNIDISRLPAAWPQEGRIDVAGLVIKYAPELDIALHGLNLSIHAGEKVGVVGRSGSGKSTLALSLLRFLNPSQGHIRIDNIDIGFIGLEDLRSRITIIPQDPILFSGTIRSNLDPLNAYEDEELGRALSRVDVLPSDYLTAKTGNACSQGTHFYLNAEVSTGGANLSQGQKQLLCLARAILRNSKVVIMDEATANIDQVADQRIQTIIRQEFAHSTLLCIAHRLRTIIDYDRVIVLDNGRLVEFDTPSNLLRRKGSIFRQLCESEGDSEAIVEFIRLKTFDSSNLLYKRYF